MMALLPSAPLLGRQWYLHGNGLAQPAVHLNVLPAWAGYAGRGVRIGSWSVIAISPGSRKGMCTA